MDGKWLVGPPALVGRVLWNRVWASFRPWVLPPVRVFSLNSIIIFFLNFGMMLETHTKLCMTEPDFLEKKFLPPKLGEWTKMGQKQGFLNILKNFVVNFYWICSIMKMSIICYVPVQIPYLGTFWFLRYGPKCSRPIRLQNFLINHISIANQ